MEQHLEVNMKQSKNEDRREKGGGVEEFFRIFSEFSGDMVFDVINFR